jgi:hypothetical protein
MLLLTTEVPSRGVIRSTQDHGRAYLLVPSLCFVLRRGPEKPVALVLRAHLGTNALLPKPALVTSTRFVTQVSIREEEGYGLTLAWEVSMVVVVWHPVPAPYLSSLLSGRSVLSQIPRRCSATRLPHLKALGSCAPASRRVWLNRGDA